MSIHLTGDGTTPTGSKPRTRMSPTPNAGRGEPIEVLLVEDSPDDADLTIDALRNGRVRNRITHVEDGIQATELVRQKDMLFSLEEGVDGCEDAMDVIRSVMVKNG